MTCFGNTKKVVDEYLSDGKGKLVLVSGGVRNNTYEKDGEKKYEIFLTKEECVKAKIASLEYIQNELNGVPNIVR